MAEEAYLLVDSNDCAVNLIHWDGTSWQEWEEQVETPVDVVEETKDDEGNITGKTLVRKLITQTVKKNNGGYQIPGGLRAFRYSGPWGVGWKWNGTTCVDPNPAPPAQAQSTTAPPASTPSPGIKTI